MNILIIHPSFKIYGGAEIIIVRFCNYLIDKGHSVTIWTQLWNKDIIDLSGKVSLYINDYKNPDNVYDVVNPHNHPAEIKSLLYDKRVWYCNEPPEHILQGFPATESEIDIVSNIDRVAVADEMNEYRFHEVYNYPLSKIHKVPYGVDYSYWGTRIPNAKDRLKLKDKFVVLCPCWFNPYKNQLGSVKILQNLIEYIPDIKMIFTGYNRTPYGKQVSDYVSSNNLWEYVDIPSFYNTDILREYYSASDVMLCPFGRQGGFISVFEGIAHKIPVVISDEMGACNLVDKHHLGDIATYGKDYVKYIRRIHDSGIGKDILDSQSKWVRDNLTWDNYSKKMVDIFEQVC